MPVLSSQQREGSEAGTSRGESGRAPGRSMRTSRLPARKTERDDEGSRPAAAAAEPAAAQSRAGGERDAGDPFGLHLLGSSGGGASEAVAPAGESEVASPALAESPAPTIQMLLPKKDAYLNEAPFDVQVQGQPFASVVVYLTHYFGGKVRHNFHEVVTLDENGAGVVMGTIPIDKDPGHHALFARASHKPGAFSPVRVAEFDSAVETYGGGV